MVAASVAMAQTLNTGDKELDAHLTKINTDAKADLTAVKQDLATTFNTTVAKVDGLIQKGMAVSDVYMALELAKITKKPVENVVKVYETHKKQGWGAIAKELGIKPGSPEFHQLKGDTKKRADKGKPAGKGKPATPGKGKPKGKG